MWNLAKPIPTIVTIALLTFALQGCGGGPLSLASRLPANGQIDGWTLSGKPVVADSDTDLYKQIDGGGPIYIDRGWVSSVFATYVRGDSTLAIAIHDMGNAENAQAIFLYALPVSRIEINGSSAVVDMSFPTAYSAKAYVSRYYIEVSIDERSDAALDAVERFTVAIMQRCE
jgi:hypothetical protein